MLEFFRRFFKISAKEKLEEEIKVYQNHDIIDYDGMGNQGRFPTSKK